MSIEWFNVFFFSLVCFVLWIPKSVIFYVWKEEYFVHLTAWSGCTAWVRLSATPSLGCSLRIQSSWRNDWALFSCCPPSAESSSSPGNYAWVHNCLTLTIYNLVLICILSILFSIHFLRCWQGEFVKQWRASFVGNNFLHSQNLNVWIRADVVRRKFN